MYKIYSNDIIINSNKCVRVIKAHLYDTPSSPTFLQKLIKEVNYIIKL